MDPKSRSQNAEGPAASKLQQDKKKKRRRRLKVKPILVPRKIKAGETNTADQPQPSTSREANQLVENTEIHPTMHDEEYDSTTSYESGGNYSGDGNSFKELASDNEEDARKLEALIELIKERKQMQQSRPQRERETTKQREQQGDKQQKSTSQIQPKPQPKSSKRKEKIPPINILEGQTQNTVELCRLAIGSRFYIKRISSSKHILICQNIQDYKKIKSVLEQAQTQFYSYTPKSEKTQSVLLKGVDPDAEPEELLDELKNFNSETLKFVAVKRFTTVNSRNNQRKLPIFLVQLSPESKVDSLRNIKYLNYHVVTWDKIKKRDNVLQCMRCQRFGHAASNCNLPYRCVKCEQSHKPGECPLGKEKVNDRSKLFCVLCRQNGHPANYRGCPKYEELKNRIRARKQQIEEEKRQKSRMYQNFVAPNVSFAQMAAGQGTNTRQQPQKAVPTAGNDMDLKAVLLSIQGQIAQLQKQLNEQATRIDIIYSTLFSEPNAP